MDVSRAACRNAADPEVFFTLDMGDGLDRASTRAVNHRRKRKAMTYCDHCPIKQACRDENLTVPYGIFGGLGPISRRAIAEPLGIEFDQPDLDEVAVDRRMAGDRVRINRLERLELVRRLLRSGYGYTQIGEMAGANSGTISLVKNASTPSRAKLSA